MAIFSEIFKNIKYDDDFKQTLSSMTIKKIIVKQEERSIYCELSSNFDYETMKLKKIIEEIKEKYKLKNFEINFKHEKNI